MPAAKAEPRFLPFRRVDEDRVRARLGEHLNIEWSVETKDYGWILAVCARLKGGLSRGYIIDLDGAWAGPLRVQATRELYLRLGRDAFLDHVADTARRELVAWAASQRRAIRRQTPPAPAPSRPGAG